MNARFHRSLGWIFVIAVAGLAGCTGPEAKKPAPGTTAPGTPTPGTPAPGTPTPGTPAPGARGRTQNVECLGPSNLSTAAREQLANQICSSDMGRAVRTSGRNRCANIFAGRSDAQIAGLLSAHDAEIIRQSTAAEQTASDPTVRDLAHLLVSAHTRLRTEQSASLKRGNLRPEETAESRAFGGGLHAEYSAIAQGEGFDREYVARQVEQQHRALMMIDALAPQTRNTDVRCGLESARLVAETALDQACWVWSAMGNVTGRIAGQRARGQGTQMGQGPTIGQGTQVGQGTEVGGQGTQVGQGTEVGGQGTQVGQGTEVGGQGTEVGGQGTQVGQGTEVGQGGEDCP